MRFSHNFDAELPRPKPAEDSLRLLLYNIRYAMGSSGARFHLPVPGIGYLRDTRQNFIRLTRFIKAVEPDIVGLIEIDTGSLRSGRTNQVEALAKALGHSPSYQCKYAVTSLNTHLPIIRKQANAFLTRNTVKNQRFHYFDTGIKRLIIELELEQVCIFLVHLSLKYRHRHFQLRHLYSLVANTAKPVIVAGDFNTLWGEYEIELFMKATDLQSANRQNLASWPSRSPRKQLDFILHSGEVEILDFQVPKIRLSDHLPLVCDFRVNA